MVEKCVNGRGVNLEEAYHLAESRIEWRRCVQVSPCPDETSSTENAKRGSVISNDYCDSSEADCQAALYRETIVIYGTGDLGRALVTCLVKKGFRVFVASRNPDKHRSQIERLGGEVESYKAATQQGEIVIIAIPFEAFQSLPADLLKNKVVVDVSNRPLKHKRNGPSLACQLQEILSESKVVKAFNTLSAYGLQNNICQGCTQIPICSDHDDAKEKVKELIRNLGFSFEDRGTLSSSKEIEDIPMTFFPEWRLAAKMALAIFIFTFIYMFFWIQLCPNIERAEGENWNWALFKKIPLSTCHTSFALTAITLLALCYLPGVIASFIQLYRRTKYSAFPRWLDNWLRCRKYIGLSAQAFASMHALMAILYLIQDGIEGEWRDFVFLMFGAFALGMMTILGITSLPSVSSALSWREFSFLHRHLGWWCLTCAVLHLTFKKWSKLISNNQRCVVFPDPGQTYIILPLVTVLLKLILLLPCIDSQIQKIRRGYEGKGTASKLPV